VTSPREIEATPAEASALLRDYLLEARRAISRGELDPALGRFVTALGLALQLGPAAIQHVLVEVMGAAREMARDQDAEALSALGPALVGSVVQVHEADALPPTAVMRAWAELASALGVLIGQLGLALTLPAEHRAGMVKNARTRAAVLDDSTDSLFALAEWVEEAATDGPREEDDRGPGL
jgi:hypothetical protein